MRIDGSAALVTGAASGLGEATARHLHSLGASVVLFDRDAARATAIAAELGARAQPAIGDALSEADVQTAVDSAGEMAPLRIAVLCAGGATYSERTLARDGSAHDLARFQETIDLNVVTTFNSLRLAASAMAKLEPLDDDGERGTIVSTSSIAGYEGQIGQIAYGAAKAAIIGMTLIAARDLAVSGVRVNSIAPGTIDTRAWDQAPPEMREHLEAKVPFPSRFGRPDEFASLVEHLVTNAYLNGQVVRLDGAVRFDPK